MLLLTVPRFEGNRLHPQHNFHASALVAKNDENGSAYTESERTKSTKASSSSISGRLGAHSDAPVRGPSDGVGGVNGRVDMLQAREMNGSKEDSIYKYRAKAIELLLPPFLFANANALYVGVRQASNPTAPRTLEMAGSVRDCLARIVDVPPKISYSLLHMMYNYEVHRYNNLALSSNWV